MTSPLEAVKLGPICTFNTNKIKRKWRSLVNLFSISLSWIDKINSYFYELLNAVEWADHALFTKDHQASYAINNIEICLKCYQQTEWEIMDIKFLLWVLGYGYRQTLVCEHLEVLLCNENHLRHIWHILCWWNFIPSQLIQLFWKVINQEVGLLVS